MDEHRRSPFGNALRQLREAAALSQEELAERAGLSVRGVSDLERGARSTPRLETVRMLADGLELGETERRELLAARNRSPDALTTHALHAVPALPVPVTSFIGREVEITTIGRMIQSDHHRLITLLGPGGVGKTRLAIQIAHERAVDFKGGAAFVDLSPIRDPELVIPAIASRLGVTEQTDRNLKESLSVALQGRQLLLVLDNLEQVIGAATDIAWLHASFPDLVVIVTSRVRLRVAGEHVLPVETMPLPVTLDASALQNEDAVTLFLDRAKAVDPGFSLDDSNAEAVAAIVTRLQGMPLAIELAAARIRLWPVADLLKRLETQLPTLTGGSRDAPHRHSTMRETIAWSYELLSPTEQAVFRALAIFPDGCMLETAVAVCGADGSLSELETLDAVEALVDSSMLRRREGSDGLVRYRMLQTVREYGLEQLAAAGEESIVRHRVHVAWCLPLARRAEFFMVEPDEVYWLNVVAAEYQNLREHIHWMTTNDFINEALEISGALATFRMLRSHMVEGRHELEMLLAHPRALETTIGQMRGYIGLGIICNHQGDSNRGLDIAQAGVTLARELGDKRDLALALNVLAISLFRIGQLEASERVYEELAQLAEAIDNPFFVASCLHGRASIADNRGQLEESERLLQESLAICQSAGHVWGSALCKHNLGYGCLRSGSLDEAERLVLEAQQDFALLQGRGDSAGLYLTLAEIARLRKDHTDAIRMLEQAIAIAHENGNILDIIDGQLGLAQIFATMGDFVVAREHTYHAIQWHLRSWNAEESIRCLNMLVDISIATHEAHRAARCMGAVDGLLEKHGMSRTRIESDEYRLRSEHIMRQLGEQDWQRHYDHGQLLSIEDVLAEVQSWQSCR